MNIDHAELRAAAEAATPGPWRTSQSGYGVWSDFADQWVATGCDGVNAAHIALASPDVVLGLLDGWANAQHTVLCQEAEIERLRDALDAVHTDAKRLRIRYPDDAFVEAVYCNSRALAADATHGQVIE